MGKSRNGPASNRSASKNPTITASDCSRPGDRKKPAPGLLERSANVGLLNNSARSGQVSRIAIRPALLAGVAACALSLASAPTPALAQTLVTVPGTVPNPPCTYDLDTDTLTCEGDLSGGVTIDANDANNPVAKATIEKLTKAITPGSGVAGVTFSNTVGGDTTLTVDAAAYGITTQNNGGVKATMGADGNLTLDVAGAITVTGNEAGPGIYGGQTNKGRVSIKSVGDIDTSGVTQNGGVHGIYAYSKNDGVDVESTGTIKASGHGVAASGRGQLVTVNSTGDIEADGRAIYAYSRNPVTNQGPTGSARVEIESTGKLTSRGGDAIYAYATNYVSITSKGTIDAEHRGIHALGINGVSIKSDGDITTNPATGHSQNEGAIVANAENGFMSVDSVGDLESENGYGVRAWGLHGAAVTSAGDIKAMVGIRVSSNAGDVYLRSEGDIVTTDPGTGRERHPAPAALFGSTQENGAVTIVSKGNLSSVYEAVGIWGEMFTTTRPSDAVLKDMTITSTGDIDVGGTGIFAYAEIQGGASNVRAPGALTGDIIITSTGDVNGDSKAGIYAYSQGGGVDITSVGDVSSEFGDAIWARTQSTSGVTRIDSTGALYAGGDGVKAYSYAAVDITSDGDIEAGEDGIDADSYEDVKVVSTGDIDAGDSGIDAYGETGDVYVYSSGAIQAAGEGGFGIRAFSGGDADVYVKSVGPVTASDASSTGIYAGLADSSNNNDEVRIVSSGAVTAGGKGIYARVVEGDGDVFIDSSGAVAGVSEAGVGILGTAYYGDVTITFEGDVSGGAVGIRAYSYDGDVAINSTGGVTAGAVGIDAGSENGVVSVVSKGPISVSSEVVSGEGAHGIRAGSRGRVVVNSAGAVTAKGASSFGIEAYSSSNDVEIYSSGAVTAGGTGVSGAAGTENSGNVTITSIGDVAGAAGYGIRAKAQGGDVTVTSDGDVTGAKAAIFAYAEYDSEESGDYDYSSLYAATTGGELTIPTVTTSAINASAENGEGESGDITIVSNGDLTATGEGGDAVRVVSGFSASSNLVTISIGSAVTGGSGEGAGVRFTGGGTNRLENSGTITALSGVAIVGGDGAEEIVNTGTLIGSVSLGAGNDRVEISGAGDISGATFDGGEGDDTFRLATTRDGAFAGGTVNNFEVFEMAGTGTWSLIGDHAFATSTDILGGVLDLRGTLSSLTVANSGGSLAVGGVGAAGIATIDGDYAQKAGGDLMVDLDLESGEGDLLTVFGTASLAGTVTPAYVNAASGDLEFTILTATGGVTDNGLTLNDFSSPLISAELIYPNANDVAIAVSVAFTPPDIALTNDQTAIADNLEAVFEAGGSDGAMGEMFDALFFDTEGDAAYAEALDQLSPEVFLSTQTASYYAAGAFSDGMFSCADKTDAATLSREGECLWLRVGVGGVDVDGHGATIGFEEEVFGVTAGWQFEVAENWQVGVGGGFESVEIDADGGARSEGDRFMGGISAKHQRGPWRLSAALSGGVADYETTRTISFGGFSDTLRSAQDIAHGALELRAAYQFDFDGWYAQPFVRGNATWVDLGDVTEHGGSAALLVEGDNQRFFSLTPGVEVGAEFTVTDALALKPFARLGASFVDNPELGLTAGFIEAPSGAGAFTESADVDSQFANIEVGVTLFKLGGGGSKSGGRFGELGGRAAVSLVYEGRVSENTTRNNAFIKAAFPF